MAFLCSGPSSAQESATASQEPLPRRHRLFLEEVDGLLGDEERSAFLGLSRNYQRDRFIDRFWRVRDPYPQTPRNEFRDRWEANAEIAHSRFEDLSDPRAQMILFFGPEKRSFRTVCSDLLAPLEIWYFDAVAGVRPDFYLVFRRLGSDRVRLWNPRDGIGSLRSSARATIGADSQFALEVRQGCSRGDDIVDAIVSSADWEEVADRAKLRPAVQAEWVQSFLSRSTDVPADAPELAAEVRWNFPGAYQSRTVVQLMMSVDRDAAKIATLGERSAYRFLVDGEILRQGKFFESFRYKFDLPVSSGDLPAPSGTAPTAVARLPLAVQRYLRAGTYTWVIKLQDLNAHTFFRREIEIDVPNLRIPTPPETPIANQPVGTLELWSEANSSLQENPLGDHSLILRAPADRLLVGIVRVLAQTTGEGIAKVVFHLNGKPILSKRRAPYSVEINLGRAPRMHTLRAIAMDGAGAPVAHDELLLNSGPHRFGIRLIEPQRGQRYASSVRARAEVDVPRTEALDRVEFFLNETLVATLYQEPFVQPILIPAGQDLGFVRAVAYLPDGRSVEDLVFVNSPHPIESLQVNFVELYASVFDGRGRPVEDLELSEITVSEDGVQQQIRRFGRIEERPIHAGILLDTSISMTDSLKEAETAALIFFESVVRNQDRACLITFNDKAELVVPFTNDVSVLAGGLAGLVSEGQTALYDSLIFTLHYFSGLQGKRAVVLISDGADSNSVYSFEEVLEFARRAGVAIYTVGLQIPMRETIIRQKLIRLAQETGGRSFFVESADGLDRVYKKVETELRSQYLIAYQSSKAGTDDRFREIDLKVSRKGIRAKTMRGYYP